MSRASLQALGSIQCTHRRCLVIGAMVGIMMGSSHSAMVAVVMLQWFTPWASGSAAAQRDPTVPSYDAVNLWPMPTTLTLCGGVEEEACLGPHMVPRTVNISITLAASCECVFHHFRACFHTSILQVPTLEHVSTRMHAGRLAVMSTLLMIKVDSLLCVSSPATMRGEGCCRPPYFAKSTY